MVDIELCPRGWRYWFRRRRAYRDFRRVAQRTVAALIRNDIEIEPMLKLMDKCGIPVDDLAAQPSWEYVPADERPSVLAAEGVRAPRYSAYLQLMMRVGADLDESIEGMPKKVVRHHIEERWDRSVLGEPSDHLLEVMATLLRAPEARRGGPTRYLTGAG